MPLPAAPLTLHGGCNCRAVRYTIHIPHLSDRPLHPSVAACNPQPISDDMTMCRLPFVTWDHCNDCRAATGAVLPAWICTPASTVTVTCVVADSALASSKEDRQYPDAGLEVPAGKFPVPREPQADHPNGETSTITRPGLDLLAPPFIGAIAAPKTWLRHYGSGEGRTRSFCGRCGTPIVYNLQPMPDGWPEMLDFVLGTVDREDLQREVEDDARGHDRRGLLQPERQLWCTYGIPWVRDVSSGFDGPKHAIYAPDKAIDDDES